MAIVMLPTKPSFPFVRFTSVLSWALAVAVIAGFAGCDPDVAAPASPGPKQDTLPKSDSSQPAPDPWDAPYPKGTPDSLLAGDFAPIAVGNAWTYHETAGIPSPGDPTSNYLVSRIDVRVLDVQASAMGRRVRMERVRRPLFMHTSRIVADSSLEWDAPVDTAATRWEGDYLERGDVFYLQDRTGHWLPADSAYGPGPHRALRSQADTLGDYPRYGRVFIRADSAQPGHQEFYAEGVGLIRIENRPAPGITIVGELVSFNAHAYADSLARDLARPLIKKDSLLTSRIFAPIEAGLPQGYCSQAGSPAIADSNLALADFTPVRAGEAWEYLAVNDTSNTGFDPWSGAHSSSHGLKGLTRFLITDVLSRGSCLLFAYAVKDSLFVKHSSVSSIQPPWDSLLLRQQINGSSGFGVKRGAEIFRLSLQGDSVRLDTFDLGVLREGILWPFASGKSPVALGDSARVVYATMTLHFVNTAAGRRLAYQIDQNGSMPDPTLHQTLIRGLGLSSGFYAVPNFFGAYGGGFFESWSRSLFAYDGAVVDAVVKARYDSLGLVR